MRRATPSVVVLVGLLVPMLIGAVPAQAATVTRVTSLTVPAEPVDLETSPGALIRVHVVDPVGIDEQGLDPTGDDPDYATYLAFDIPGQPQDGGYVHAGRLVSGTPQDGEWEFGPFAGSRAFGPWEAKRLHVLRLDGTFADINLRLLGFENTFFTVGRFGASFDRYSPTTNQNTIIRYGETVTLKGRLIWSDEGGRRYPLPGRLLTVLQEDNQEPVIDGDERVIATAVTAADGTYSVTVMPERNAFRIYVSAERGTSPEGVRYHSAITFTGRVDVTVRIGIRSRPTTLPSGTVGYVEGTIVPLHTGQLAYLQRYTRTGWTTVSSAAIRASGRFTLAAQPPTPGKHRYRVYKASDADHRGDVTPEFVITGT
jgi:hypothetical protein